jgi:hypothetical protein
MRPRRSEEGSYWSAVPLTGRPHAVEKSCRRISLCKEGLIVALVPGEDSVGELYPPAEVPSRSRRRNVTSFPIDGPYRVAVLFQARGASIGPRIIGRSVTKWR